MASAADAWNGLLTYIKANTTQFTNPPIMGFINIINDDVLSDLTSGQFTAVAIYDLNMARNVDKWRKTTINEVVMPTNLVSSVHSADLLTTNTLDINNVPFLNDAVGVTFQNKNQSWGVAVTSVAGDTPTTLATKLAAAINADTTLQNWVSATSAGGVVTCTNISAGGLSWNTKTGNIGTRTNRVGQSLRMIQISVYSQQQMDSEAVGSQILSLIADAEKTFGLQLADQTWARLKYVSDMPGKDTALADIWKWDITVSMEITLTLTETLYSVLAERVSVSPN